jgi:hypothetical protein
MIHQARRSSHHVSRLNVWQPSHRRQLVVNRLRVYAPFQALDEQSDERRLICEALRQFENSKRLSLIRCIEIASRLDIYPAPTVIHATKLLEEGKVYALSFLVRDED